MIDILLRNLKSFFQVQDKAKFLKQNIPYLAFFYLGDVFSNHIRAYSGGDVIDKIFQGILEIDKISLVPSIHPVDLLIGLGIAALIKFIIYSKGKKPRSSERGLNMGRHVGEPERILNPMWMKSLKTTSS